MPAEKPKPTAAGASRSETTTDGLPEHVSNNIDSIIAFYRREETKLSDAQRRLEQIGRWIGRPSYLLYAMTIVLAWLAYNVLGRPLNFPQFDPPPFPWLQGLLSLGAFLTTTVVLITQNRLSRVEAQRLNLDLQLNLLTEQKTTKLIHLLEELRRDLPMVHDRHDAVAAALQAATDPTQVLEALAGQTDGDGAS